MLINTFSHNKIVKNQNGGLKVPLFDLQCSNVMFRCQNFIGSQHSTSQYLYPYWPLQHTSEQTKPQSHKATKPQSQKDTTDIRATFSKQLKNNCTHGPNQSCAPIQLRYVGLDVFDPQQICAQRTRRGLAHSKDWAIILFASMSTHVIESMDSSSFINVQLYSADSQQ